MSKHLLLVTIGPVQEFIAQARRTRDLWYGSHLLSEISKAAAKAVQDGGGELVFPATDKPADLDPSDQPFDTNDQPVLNVANKILAELPDGVDPEGLARAAREAALDRWRRIADCVRRRCAGLLADLPDGVWEEQIATLLEFYAAWAPIGDTQDGYRQALDAVEDAVAGRKSLREFKQWRRIRGGVPKSSLDGARETVLAEPDDRDPELVRRYRIPRTEQLDAVGLVKRAGGEPEQFVPIATVALASWVYVAAKEVRSDIENLRRQCEQTLRYDGGRRLLFVSRPTDHWVSVFPYDAVLFLPERWTRVFRELYPDRSVEEARAEARTWGDRFVRPILRAMHEPYPYVACLVADGDRMGAALSKMHSADEHRRFSQRLAGFAGEARAIVEGGHRGALVYSGGDDVLAFLPLPEALACAQALQERFGEVMAEAVQGTGAEAEPPTFSVGIGIGHILESMGDLLQLGRDAERLAKTERNALAVIVDKRSGGRAEWLAAWTAWGNAPAGRLRDDAKLLDGRLSMGKVYEIRTMLRRLPRPVDAQPSAEWADLLRAEVARILARTMGGERELKPEDVALDVTGDDYAKMHGEVEAWVQRMLIARVFQEAEPRARRRGGEA